MRCCIHNDDCTKRTGFIKAGNQNDSCDVAYVAVGFYPVSVWIGRLRFKNTTLQSLSIWQPREVYVELIAALVPHEKE